MTKHHLMKSPANPFSAFLVAVLFISNLQAQLPTFSWNVHWGNSEFEFGPRLATDEDGNVYCAGAFKGTVDFNPGNGDATLTSGFGGFGSDTYITKFDSTGAFQWVKRIGGISVARTILYDTSGFILIAGDYAEATDFDPGPGVYTLTPVSNSDDTYILKLDRDGNFVFAVTVGGAGNEYPGCLSMDADGNILVAGLFSGTSDFDPGPGQTIFTAGFLADLFIVKLNANGSFVWAKEFSGDTQGDINGMGTDADGNIYVTGIFDDRRDFDPGPDSVIISATGYWDIFVVKLNASGEFLWLRHLGNEGDNWAEDLIVDENSTIYVTGYFSDTIDFDPGPDELNFMATNTDPYIWKLDTDGNMIWAIQMEGVSFDYSRSVTLDLQGNVYSTGRFGDTQDFDPGPGQYLLTSTGGNDLDDGFVTKLTNEGKFVWACPLGGLGNDIGTETRIDRFGNIYTAGTFQATGGFYPGGPPQDSLVSHGSSDPYLARWKQCPETYGDIFPMTCDSYTSPSGNYTWNVSGTYLDTLTNAGGCDSILTIHLVVSGLNDEVILIDETLVAQQPTGPYQWLDCDDGFDIIAGETNQNYSPTGSGNYAVMISDGLCSDTSDCINVMIVDVAEHTKVPEITIYPNPAREDWYIDFGEVYSDASVEIFDAGGRNIFSQDYKDANTINMQIPLSPGVYAIHVESTYATAVVKLMVY